MAISYKKKLEAIDILKNYNGKNPYIQTLKYYLYNKKNYTLTYFNAEYILLNYEVEPFLINKIIKIANWFGLQKQKEWNTEFIPEKLLIGYILGETENYYHAYVKYRRNQEIAVQCFIPKRALLDQIFIDDYSKMEIDFDKYDHILSKRGRKVLEHQKLAVKFLLSRKKCILADDMGLAKTASSIIATIEGSFKKILIICPASLKTNWKREIEYFVSENDIAILDSNNFVSNKRYTILNYDILGNFYKLPLEAKVDKKTGEIITKKVKNAKTGEYENIIQYVKSRKKEIIEDAIKNSPLLLENYDLIIIDEAHKLSNDDSNRYMIINDLIQKSSKIENIYLLSGTPLTNNPRNLLNLLKLINADIVKPQEYEYYLKRYCDGKKVKTKNGHEFWIDKGASNLDELRERIKHLYLRRLKTEIPGLVNKEIIEKYYDLPNDKIKEYNNVWNEYVESQKDIGKDIDEKYRELVEGIKLRQYISTEMVPNTIELANKHLELGEKVIIMCSFDEEITLLKEYYGDSSVIYKGGLTIKQKDKAESEFMTNPDIKIFIANIISAGVGLNLVSSHICIFNSFDWVPGNNNQAMDRVHRISQSEDVTIYFQFFINTVSESMWNTVIKKSIIIESTIKSEEEKNIN
jgi:SWI/SNF-related matrix-associated actin-dependent regulator 1 of chromatin subfamily A